MAIVYIGVGILHLFLSDCIFLDRHFVFIGRLLYILVSHFAWFRYVIFRAYVLAGYCIFCLFLE